MPCPLESLRKFSYEAKQANAVLNLYQVVTDPEGPDQEKMESRAIWYAQQGILSPAVLQRLGYLTKDTVAFRDMVLGWVAGTVRRVVAQECYPELYEKDGEFHQGFGFRSLLGAMYLQMEWLITAKGKARRCQAPKCSNIISFERPEEVSEQW